MNFVIYRQGHVPPRTLDQMDPSASRRVVCTLDSVRGSLSVRTTRKTYVPYIIDIILKARELIKLLARCVHRFEQGTVREEITEGHRTEAY